jgi:hypothetical protein
MLEAAVRSAATIAGAWSGYHPHAVCLLEDPAIIAAEVVSNAGIALAYFMIPAALWRFARHLRGDLPFRSVWIMFMLFILACGTSHLTRILTLFVGGWAYWLDATVCAVTLVASLGTAVGLARHGPRIASLAGRILLPAAAAAPRLR